MKTTIPSTSKTSVAATSQGGSRESLAAGLNPEPLAQLASMMNQSPRVQKQLKLSDQIQNSDRVQKQLAMATDINHAAGIRQTGKDDSAQRKEAPSPNRTGLPDQLKSGVENLSGISLDDVRVHYNSSKPAQLNALAYAQATDINVAPGQEKHLPHEAWHVVQQKEGRVRPTTWMKGGVPVNDDSGLELEADVMGAQAMQMSIRAAAPSNPAEADVEHVAHAPNLKRIKMDDAVAQRVRGGLEFTEDTPALLHSYPPPGAIPVVNRSALWTIRGSQVSAFVVPARPANRRNTDKSLLQKGQVKLTNDVTSAEWVIERHGANVTPEVMRTNLRNDLKLMFEMLSGLSDHVSTLGAANPGQTVVLVPGAVTPLHAAPDPEGIFYYRPGSSKGKAQITIQYTNAETLRRISLLNASKFLTGTKVAEGEDISRITGTESNALKRADVGGETSFSNAGALLTQLVATSNPIPGLPAAPVLEEPQVGLIKLMVLNDALATTMVRYAARLGQAQEKNLQRVFPKSRRDEYSKAVAGALISGPNMTLLRAEIKRTAAADALLLYNASDAGALRTDEAFAALQTQGTDVTRLTKIRIKLGAGGVRSQLKLDAIKDAVLGANGALLVTWIKRAARAYTDMTGGQRQYQGTGAADPGNVIRSTEGFTPVAGDSPGAVYEFREREIEAEKPTWRNLWGGVSELEKALNDLFIAS